MLHRAALSFAGGILLAALLGGVAAAATSPFAGRWTSTDYDGSSQVLLISAGSAPAVTFQDFFASSCQNNAGPATHWVSAGQGEVDGDTLYIHFHKSGCGYFGIGEYDDWVVYDEGTDTLTDAAGITWTRNP